MNKPFIPFSDPNKVAAAEYAKKMKHVASKTIEVNQKEIDAIEQQLDALLQDGPFEYMQLPILSHTFIILDAPNRFDLLPIFIDLLESLNERIKSRDNKDSVSLKQAIDMANEVRKDDTPEDYPLGAPFDTSQFLTQYFSSLMANNFTLNHKERKFLEKIRQHMINSYKQTLAKKKGIIANCQNILSKKHYGEE